MATLPLAALRAWARLNDVDYDSLEVQEVSSKGLGLVLQNATAHDENETLLRVPQDLVLSSQLVSDFARVDKNFGQLLEAITERSTRGKIMIYLLCHLVSGRSKNGPSQRVAHALWAEYIKFLPRFVPLPTCWSVEEREMLQGTSLDVATQAKLSALNAEFEHLRQESSNLSFWQSFLWENGSATLDDWLLVDAWYRSRSLELPNAGHAMVPLLDMANHATEASATYCEDVDGNVLLLRTDGIQEAGYTEVTISYGASKSAAEMLFSYGFIDTATIANEATIPLTTPIDDPLIKAKLHIFGAAPTIKLSSDDHSYRWECPFAYLMCLNEEDGLDFRVLQDDNGDRELRLFWQEEDATERTTEIEVLIKGNPLFAVFRLRAVALVQDCVEAQLEVARLCDSQRLLQNDKEEAFPTGVRIEMCDRLRSLEMNLLENVMMHLESEKTQLLGDEVVLAYLKHMQGGTSTSGADELSRSDGDDFS